ncbi:MAG: ATP-binding protein [Chloroflexi bacterium]|nr:ATP-binding protein [Chloroflexota bacterium]
MSETFIQYLEKWLKQSTIQGLNNPLVKMPFKRFRLLQPDEFNSIAGGGNLLIGTNSDPIVRNLYKNYQTRIRERGEHCAFICIGTVDITIAGGEGQQPRAALFPVCLKRASLEISGDKIRVRVSDEDVWQINPVLQAHLRAFGITVVAGLSDNPVRAIGWVRAQLGNRASVVGTDCYVGLFSSQQMVLQQRLTEPSLRQALAHNPVIQAKICGGRVASVDLGEITDDEIEDLGLVLPCDDHQLRVVQLSDKRCCLQVEGPPGTGKSQTIANIISNAIYRGLRVLLVCDKRAAIVQVEERLNDCGIKPALLNLHDEDLDKREFLKQATEKFPVDSFSPARTMPSRYPLEQLRETRKILNERVKFGRAVAHPSLPVAKRQALAGLIQLRKELRDVPTIPVTNWQSLSKERLAKLLQSIAQWPELAEIVSDSKNVWNQVRAEAFNDNPNAANEVMDLANDILAEVQSLDDVKEMAASVGIELPIGSGQNISDILALIVAVLEKPDCHPKVLGNYQLSLSELGHLKLEWDKRHSLLVARHPMDLTKPCTAEAEEAAKGLLAAEAAVSWNDLSQREVHHKNCQAKIEESQNRYLRLCDQIGLVYSPLLKVRRAQLQAVLSLGKFGGLIPRAWWNASVHPVLLVDGWRRNLRACISHEKTAPLPSHFAALERIAATHWKHVEAMSEHGFNWVSYCLRFVDDRKCKYALQQAYPSIPLRGFKRWREVTLHAVAAQGMLRSLRASAEAHAVLKHLTEHYLAIAHEAGYAEILVEHDDVRRLSNAAALVEQWRERNDLFEVGSIHWQTFWESPNPSVLLQVEALLSEIDGLVLPDKRSDDLDAASKSLDRSRQHILDFLKSNESQDGDRTQSVLASFGAQKEFLHCQQNLAPLTKYLDLQGHGKSDPDWEFLRKVLVWRDKFEKLRGKQKLDVDSLLWVRLRDRLRNHEVLMKEATKKLDDFFEGDLEDLGDGASLLWPFGSLNDYHRLGELLGQMLQELPRHPLWLEKRRWRKKLSAFPELEALWDKIVDGSVQPDRAERLFCFNLLRLCDPIARPQGPELRQTLSSFAEQDEHLASWLLDHLKGRLRQAIQEASLSAASSETGLRRLLGLQRIRGTVRELIAAHLDYLIAAKPCWMMSPTSLANLLCGKDENRPSNSDIFERYGVPFDMVVFDEASQIRVLDGLLSMAFGKQVIIVGDKNQLPPTDFFSSFANLDAETESQDFGISESLLDEFAGVFEDAKTHVMLMSHYRSETPDLIRFSNDWFYSREPGKPGTGRLEMYPPAHISGIGRRLHHVPGATYSETAGQRNNPVEAREVVKLIELHVRDYPEKSLGVVTMNIPQMELIDELLQATPPKVQGFCSDERKFFLRNLETVQGDEMDRIILSLTYGKNPAGQFSANVLGPLTKSGGERRLNVAITRSRNGMIVVSSLRAADLAASGAQSNGFKCLKAFLTDLEASQQVRNFGIGSRRFEKQKDGVSNVVHCESPFEEQVVEFLENEGFEIECQYGDGRFRLDIVVKERGRNLLAIECDGASYHNSLVARTRDRARGRILKNRGWSVHHVWSTNWWFAEQQEKQAIIDAINAARAGGKIA